MAQGNGPTWSVTAQREDFQVGPNGQLSEGVVVTFQTTSGVVGSVFVPKADYSVERVRQAVAAKATAMAEVQALTG